MKNLRLTTSNSNPIRAVSIKPMINSTLQSSFKDTKSNLKVQISKIKEKTKP